MYWTLHTLGGLDVFAPVLGPNEEPYPWDDNPWKGSSWKANKGFCNSRLNLIKLLAVTEMDLETVARGRKK